jgi:hypothetical protein
MVRPSRTRDESKERSWSRVRQTIHLDFLPAGVIWSLAVSCVDRRSNHYGVLCVRPCTFCRFTRLPCFSHRNPERYSAKGPAV